MYNRQRLRDARHTLLCQKADDWIRFGGIQSFDGVSDSIHSGSDSHLGGKGEGEGHVVDDDFGEYFECLLRCLCVVLGLSDDRGSLNIQPRCPDNSASMIKDMKRSRKKRATCLRTSIGCWNHDLWQIGPQSDSFAQSNRRSSAHRYNTIRPLLIHHFDSIVRHMCRLYDTHRMKGFRVSVAKDGLNSSNERVFGITHRVHSGVRVQSDSKIANERDNLLSGIDLLWGSKNESFATS